MRTHLITLQGLLVSFAIGNPDTRIVLEVRGAAEGWTVYALAPR